VLYPVELRALIVRHCCNNHPTGIESPGRGREIRTPDPLLPKFLRERNKQNRANNDNQNDAVREFERSGSEPQATRTVISAKILD